MANPDDLSLLLSGAEFSGGRYDFSGARLSGDFSGRKLRGCDFSDCVLAGSSFEKCYLDGCNFQGSDWAQCDFRGATFNGCTLTSVKNAHQAKNLHTIAATGTLMDFVSIERPWWNKIDWELLGAVGRLPLFTASSAVLILLPVFFYFHALYNNHFRSWMSIASGQSETSAYWSVVAAALERIGPLPIPSLSALSLFAAFFLFCASGAYALFCPPRIKQFSRE